MKKIALVQIYCAVGQRGGFADGAGSDEHRMYAYRFVMPERHRCASKGASSLLYMSRHPAEGMFVVGAERRSAMGAPIVPIVQLEMLQNGLLMLRESDA